jgi:SAM-dependent methyltransferase
MLAGILQLTGTPTRQLILDAPAGTGRLTAELLGQDFRVVAVDISIEMMMRGEDARHLRAAPNFVGYVCADLEHLPFRNTTIDVVGSLRVMGHLPPAVKQNVLDEFRRIACVGLVVMFYLDTAILRLKRRMFQLFKLKPDSGMWYPTSHRQVIQVASPQGWNLAKYHDLVYWISESRLYVINRSGEK